MSSGQDTTPPPSAGSRVHLLGFCALSLLVAVQLWWSWRRWPDLLVDFGRELYLPWQLASGRTLYADITYLNGPLSPYVNAGLFSLFGSSSRTLIAANLIVLLAVAILLGSLLSSTGSRLATYTGPAMFLAVFAFGNYVGIGNYNFMSPYYHEATHGTLLALVAIAAMSRSMRSTSRWPLPLAALCVGLVALTKVELALAIGAAGVAFITLLPPQRRLRIAAVFMLVSPLPYVVATAYFARRMPVGAAARSVLGSAGFVLGTDIEKNRYYETVTGLDAPLKHLMELGLSTLVFAFALAAALLLARLAGRASTSAPTRWIAWSGLAALAVSGLSLRPDESARVLPAATIAALVWLWLLARRAENVDRARLSTLVLLAAFAAMSLLKMGLAPRIAHYGFFLAMPAFVLLAALMVSQLPTRLAGSPRGTVAFQVAAVVFFALLALHCMMASRSRYLLKTAAVGPPPDTVVAYHPRLDPRTAPTIHAVEWLNANLQPGETFVAIPEGLMLNYLTRRPNPTRYLTFTYPEIQAFGEDAMTDEFRRTPPDYILLVHGDPSGYGVGMWGRDPRYGQRLMRWVDANYVPIGRFRDEPFVHPRAFGIKVLKRR